MTAERKASELLREPNTSRAMVRAMAKLGRVQDDCGLLDEPDDLPEQRPTPKQSAAVIRLPLWPEPARGAPNDVLRSALFAAIQGKGREFIKHYLIAAYDGNQIEYTGEQLEQSDLDVWEQVLHLARQHPLGTVCQFKGGAFLKAIGRSRGKKTINGLASY